MKKLIVTGTIGVVLLGAIGWQILIFYWKYEYGQTLPKVEIMTGDVNRVYYLYVPGHLNKKPAPLLLAFHGGDGGGYRFPQQSSFEALANSNGFILAFPEAKHLESNEGGWQLNTRADSTQDIDYVKAVIDDIASKHKLDQKRVYATGYSLGSMFNYEIACHLADRFAAIASYAGTMPLNPDSCDQPHPTPIMHLHGKADGIITYGNEWNWKAWDSVGTMRDIRSLMEFWSDKYNCKKIVDTTKGDVQHVIHSNCDRNSRIEHYGLAGQGHAWPESINDISTYQVIWNFLSKFRLD